MHEDLEVLKGYVESLKLEVKTDILDQDKKELVGSLMDGDETTLASYIDSLTIQELSDLINKTLYG